MKLEIKELYFDDPLLAMGGAGRFLVRFMTYVGYALLVSGSLALILSDISWLRSAGVLLILFLADRLLHIGDAERNFVRPPHGSVNIALYTTPGARAMLALALGRYKALGGDIYLHVFERLLGQKEATSALVRLEVSVSEVAVKIEEHLQKSQVGGGGAEVLPTIEKLMTEAWGVALRAQSFAITSADVLAALGKLRDPEISRILDLFGISADDFEYAVLMESAAGKLRGLRRIPATLSGIAHGPYRIRHRVMNRAWTARPTPTLDQFSRDLTDLARLESVGFLVGHVAEYERLTDVLSRPGHANGLLVGEEGIGKESIVAHLAFRIVKDRVPGPSLFDKRLVELNLGALVAGADTAELRRRAEAVINEVEAAGNVILYIPNIHDILKTSATGELGVADMLLPAILGDGFSVIGTTYPREFSGSIEKRSDFMAGFEAIPVAEISEEETIRLLSYMSVILEREYKIFITLAAIRKAVKIAKRYLRDRCLPGSAELLLKEALVDAKERSIRVLTAEEIITVGARKTNAPIGEAGADEAGTLLNLEEIMHKQLVDQDEAVTAVARTLREYRSGLARSGGPMGAFLFVGPTGVGKTELAKILTEIQFGSREAIIRFDMSEFQDEGSVARFIGSADGSIPGALTEGVRAKPFSLILLDEFEKANPDVLNLFLQVLDDGRLTDGLGRTVQFVDTIIIATSNANSEFIASSINEGVPFARISEELKKRLTSIFKPELLNRFSAIVVFKPLAPEHILAIAGLELKKLAATIEEQGIALSFGDTAVAEIARLGYDPTFGARPLRGVISDRIKSVLAEKILRREITRGNSVTADFAGGEFIFKIKND